MSQTARLAVIAVASAPYREPFFARLAQSNGIALKVFYLHSRDSLRSWAKDGQYNGESVPCLTPEALYSLPVLGAVNPSLKRRLATFQPTCLIVCGHSYLSQFIAMRWARRSGIPYLLRCDHTPLKIAMKRGTRPARLSGLRGRIVRYFAERSAGALTIGRENDRFWAHYGIPPERRFFAPFAVKNELFAAAADRRPSEKDRVRADLGIPEGRLLFFAGRFVEEKNLELLIEALHLADRPGLQLLLAGDGPLRPAIERAAARHGGGRVFLAPFRSQRPSPKSTP